MKKIDRIYKDKPDPAGLYDSIMNCCDEDRKKVVTGAVDSVQ